MFLFIIFFIVNKKIFIKKEFPTLEYTNIKDNILFSSHDLQNK